MSDDAPLLRALELWPIGFEGLVSMGLAALLDFLPLGSRALRAAWVAALGLGALSWLLYRAIRAAARALVGERRSPRLLPALGLAAALSAGLGPFLLEGVVPGGATLGAALALGSVLTALGIFGQDGRTPLVLGLLLGATLLESRMACLAAVVAVTAHFALDARREAWSQTAWLAASGGLLGLAVLPVALLGAAWVEPSLGLEIARGVSHAGAHFGVEESNALRAWTSATGLLWCGFSLLGFGLSLFRARLWPWLVPLSTLFLLDAAFGRSPDMGSADPLGAVRLLGVVPLALGGPLGVTLVIRWLARERVAFFPQVSTLIVVYSFTLAFVSAEASGKSVAAREESAADAVTHELWQSLPPRAVLLIRSEPLLLRLLADRAARGSRPDVLVISVPEFERGGAQAEALARDPALVPLVRDMLLSGQPSEYALSELSDRRPLYVELGTGWDTRIWGHLVPRPFLGQYASHPLGRSDRKTGLERARATDVRVIAAARAAEGDAATRAWVAHGFRERASMLAALGDRELARLAVNDVLTLLPEDELGLALKAKLDEPGRGPVASRAF